MTWPPVPKPGRLLAGVASAALAAAAAAAPARADTLGQAIAYAYETNPGLQAQRAALRALDESYVQARTGFGLQIGAQVGVNNSNFRAGTTDITSDTDSESVSLVQPLYTGGRVAHRVGEAEAQIRGGRESLRRFEFDLITRVVQAYVGVRRDDQLVTINADTVQVLQRELSNAEAKAKVGQLTRTDTAQSTARLAQARSSLAAAQAQAAVSRAQYLAAVGRPAGALEAPPALDSLPGSIDVAWQAAESNNPQLRASVFAEQGSRARVAEARAGRMPSVTARLDFSRAPLSAVQPSQGMLSTRTASISLTQPIFTSGQISSGIRQAVEENNRDRLNIDETRLQVTQQVSAAWEQLAASRRQTVTFAQEVDADEFAFYGVRQEEKFALRSTIEVLNAELELTNAQQNLVRVRASEYIGRVQLLSVVGTLDARLFAAATPAYDVAANLKRVRDIGATPLEAPARVFDHLLAPRTPPARPASIAEARPQGSDLPPPPTDTNAPVTSILTIQNRPPPSSTDPAAPDRQADPQPDPQADPQAPVKTSRHQD